MHWTLGIGVGGSQHSHHIAFAGGIYQQRRGALRAPKCDRRHHPVGTQRDPHQGSTPNDARGATRHVWQQVPGTNRLPTVRRTRYTTGHPFRHRQTRPIPSQPSSDPPGRSPTRLTIVQSNEEMDPQSRRRRRGRSWIHGLRRKVTSFKSRAANLMNSLVFLNIRVECYVVLTGDRQRLTR